jgi:hypothetical protein
VPLTTIDHPGQIVATLVIVTVVQSLLFFLQAAILIVKQARIINRVRIVDDFIKL